MNWSTILLVYILNIRGERDIFKVKKAIFIENNFWKAEHFHLKTNRGYLHNVKIEVGYKTSGYTIDLVSLSRYSYFLKFTNLGYIILGDNINYVTKTPLNDKTFLRFRFLFTDKPIKDFCDISNYEVRIQEFITYKFLEETPNNNIELRNVILNDISLRHIKDRFKEFVCLKLLKFEEYIRFLDKKKEDISSLEDNEILDLYYFEYYSEYIENLKKIIKDLSYLKLIKNDVDSSFTSVDEKTTLKVWEFRKLLFEKFYANLRKMYGIEIGKNWEILFSECFNFIKNEILDNNLFLPIGGKINFDYYIAHLSNILHKLVKDIRKKYSPGSHNYKGISFCKIAYFLQSDLEKLQLSVVKALYETKYIHKYFSKLLGREVKKLDDYVELEEIIHNYHNIFVYVSNLYHKFNKKSFGSYFYISSNLIDDYKINIVYGIEIENNNSAKYMQIKGFDDKGKKVKMIKDTDYFIDEFGKLYCPSEVLVIKKIQEIEVISFKKKMWRKRFKIKLKDKFELAPNYGDYSEIIIEKINKKYIRKNISDLGIGIELIGDIEIYEKRLVQDFILSTVKFKLLFFRFIRDEILNGTVTSQSLKGVSVSVGFFDKIMIEPDYLPEENESTNIIGENNIKHFAWVWKYKENRLVIKNGEEVRMKILFFDEKTGQLYCSFKDPGLGPMSWW